MSSDVGKRTVTTCIPCYKNKQKCDRRYPCNRCLRRGHPDGCLYVSQAQPASIENPRRAPPPHRTQSRDHLGVVETGIPVSRSSGADIATQSHPKSSSLVEFYGYFGNNGHNSLELLRRLGISDELGSRASHETYLNQDSQAHIKSQRALERFPDRPTLDFLVNLYVSEINWMDQLVQPTWLLPRYQAWWAAEKPLKTVSEVELGILILRISAYMSRFLPSRSHAVDQIRGWQLHTIRKTCDDVADDLTVALSCLDSKASLYRVLHLSFAGLTHMCEGRMGLAWDSFGHAIRVAHRLGVNCMSLNANKEADDTNDPENEMRRRTWCNLLIWNSFLSRQLGGLLSIPISPNEDVILRSIPAPSDAHDASAAEQPPEPFTERILQARLACFWLQMPSGNNEDPVSEYDIIQVQDRYDAFCTKYLSLLPHYFALYQPDEKWDEQLPKLPLQRRLLHVTIFGTLCRHFRPVLLQDKAEVQRWPRYKGVLLESQKRLLAVAAIEVQNCVESLYTQMEDSHARLVNIILITFEAIISLLSLLDLEDKDFLATESAMTSHMDTFPSPIEATTDPLAARSMTITRHDCWQAVEMALRRLETLAIVSTIADTGARIAAKLTNRVRTKTLEPRSSLGSLNGSAENPFSSEMNRTWMSNDSFSMDDAWADLFPNGDSFSQTDFSAVPGPF